MGDTIDNDTADTSSETPPDVEQDQTGQADSAAGEEQLGDGGRKALDQERKARRDAERALKRQEAELEKLRTAQLSETERAVAEAKAAGRAEALQEANAKLVKAEAIAAAAGKLRDPELAASLLGNLEGYVDDSGDIDGERIAADIDELVTARPYLGVDKTPPAAGDDTPPPVKGTVSGGPKGEQATTFKRSQLRDPAFYQANKEAILAAAAEGRIVDDD